MEQDQAIRLARAYALRKGVPIDVGGIHARRMSASSLGGLVPFQGDIWLVRVPLMGSDDCVESVSEITVVVSDASGEVFTIRGL